AIRPDPRWRQANAPAHAPRYPNHNKFPENRAGDAAAAASHVTCYCLNVWSKRFFSRVLDEHGKLITEDFRIHLKEQIRSVLKREFASMDDFLKRWTEAERKQAVLAELQEQGLPLEVLAQAVPKGEELDPFDLVAHIAFDQPPLSRRERANIVRKRNYFTKYGDEARAVLEALLEKYADHGIRDIEDPKILELPPFSDLGTKTHIRRAIFGGNEAWTRALTDLEQALYSQDLA
ncbi:MAG: type I restriction-modification enzyme R subunit C-terminal domain-containing protein, partial [Verrucomicrobiota bacterium JB022]|nr:type I restriction-modification enzyme R subunit C-terminal domain-containing protein [Verrucomicrobiota bacterium JB022]